MSRKSSRSRKNNSPNSFRNKSNVYSGTKRYRPTFKFYPIDNSIKQKRGNKFRNSPLNIRSSSKALRKYDERFIRNSDNRSQESPKKYQNHLKKNSKINIISSSGKKKRISNSPKKNNKLPSPPRKRINRLVKGSPKKERNINITKKNANQKPNKFKTPQKNKKNINNGSRERRNQTPILRKKPEVPKFRARTKTPIKKKPITKDTLDFESEKARQNISKKANKESGPKKKSNLRPRVIEERKSNSGKSISVNLFL